MLTQATLLPESLSGVAERCYASGHAALENGDDAQARLFFLLLALVEPRGARSYLGLGLSSERLRQHPLAAALYALGLRLAGESPWLAFGYARTLRILGREHDAERAFDRAEASTREAAVLTVIARERACR